MSTRTAVPAAVQAPVWVPAMDRRTGTIVLVMEAQFRHLASDGVLALELQLVETGEARGPTATAVAWSEPRTLDAWSDVFEVSPTTMGRWFRTGTIQAHRRGRLWRVAMSEIPGR